MPDPAIHIAGLTKSYGDVQALQGVDISIAKGEFYVQLDSDDRLKQNAIEKRSFGASRQSRWGECSKFGEFKSIKFKFTVCFYSSWCPIN